METLITLIFLAVCIVPIPLGIIKAKKKGRSPHWMWLGIIPLWGLIVCIVMFLIPGLKRCTKCGEKNKLYSRTCQRCNVAFDQNTTQNTIMEQNKSEQYRPLQNTMHKETPQQIIRRVLTIASVIAAFIFVIFMLVQVLLKNSSTYKMAIEELTNNPIANELTGGSIKQRGFIFGSTRTSGASGEADLRFNISSANGDFIIFAAGVLEFGEWRLTGLYAVNEEQGRNSIIPGHFPFEGSWYGVDDDGDEMTFVFSSYDWEISWPGTVYEKYSGSYTWSGNTVTLISEDGLAGQVVISEDNLTGNIAEVTFTLTRW